MENQRFTQIVDEFIEQLRDLMVKKGIEYAGAIDRLENFKRAAALQGIEPEQALLGMLTKHTVSIAMLCEKGQFSDLKLWDEKLGDNVVYSFLLRALIHERAKPERIIYN